MMSCIFVFIKLSNYYFILKHCSYRTFKALIYILLKVLYPFLYILPKRYNRADSWWSFQKSMLVASPVSIIGTKLNPPSLIYFNVHVYDFNLEC